MLEKSRLSLAMIIPLGKTGFQLNLFMLFDCLYPVIRVLFDYAMLEEDAISK